MTSTKNKEISIQIFYYSPNYSKWIFILVLLVLSFIYSYDKILFLRPQSVHQWRQCDCLSWALEYYKDKNSFFEPSFQNLGTDGTGKCVAEFPLIYYSVAQLWKLFGYHEFIFRLIVMTISFTALYFLFRMLEDILKDSFWSLLIVAMLFTSPVLVYYTNNFLTGVPAFSFAVFGLYFFWKFYRTSQNKYFYLFCMFFVIGGLLKVTAMLTFIAIALLFLIEQSGRIKLKPNEKIFQYPKKQLLSFSIVFLILAIWYSYAQSYNTKHQSDLFLLGVLHIWELSSEQIKRISLSIFENIKWVYFSPTLQLVLVVLFALILIFWKKVNKFLLIFTLFAVCGFLIYVFLFFQYLDVHDYYMIDFFIVMPIISLTFLLTLKKNREKIFNSVLLRIVAVIFLIHNIDLTRMRMNGRYREAGMLNKNRTQFTYALEDITPYLRSIGINRDDKVISFPDGSINISLYLMDVKGWTNFNVQIDSSKIREKIEVGAKYLFIYDKELYNNAQLQPFTKNKIGNYKIVDIYKL